MQSKQIPLQGQCLCSLCLVWLSVKKKLEFITLYLRETLVWNLVEPLSLKKYFIFFCVLMGVATNCEVIMVNGDQIQKVFTASFINLREWLPVTTPMAGRDGIKVIGAKLLRKT